MTGLRHIRLAGVALMALTVQGALSAPVQAQTQTAQDADARLRKLEAEVKAVQRVVFPGGDAKLFPGAAALGSTSVTASNGTPATTPLTDVLTRMDAIEAQNARLTAQVEELSNKLRQSEAGHAGDAGVAAVSAPAAAAPVPARILPEAAPAPKPVAMAPKPAAPAPTPVIAKPAPTRVAAVKAIVKPQSGDPGEDDYSYAFKLWEAKFYPEAEQQLKLYLDQYPKHKRVSYARNLLGRALLDDGKPREAAAWFLQNYQASKKGERAADSLLYLADSMIQMKDINRACIALGEFSDGYPGEAQGRLRGAYEGVRAKVQCN